jgi:hypothetical protein
VSLSCRTVYFANVRTTTPAPLHVSANDVSAALMSPLAQLLWIALCTAAALFLQMPERSAGLVCVLTRRHQYTRLLYSFRAGVSNLLDSGKQATGGTRGLSGTDRDDEGNEDGFGVHLRL